MNIVVGYIGTPEGRAALERAVAEAALRDAHLVVVRRFSGQEEGEQILHARDELEDVDDRLTKTNISFEIRELARGSGAGDEIVEVAREVDAELIVIGIRRRSPVGKLILGSNAQDILLNADCPVLAVKAGDDG